MSVKPKFQKNTMKSAPNRPKCRIHGSDMVYDVEMIRWKCPRSECPSVAYPNNDMDGRPVMGKGPVMLVLAEDVKGDKHYFLKSENNVMMSIDKLMVNETITRGGRRILHIACDNEITLTPEGK